MWRWRKRAPPSSRVRVDFEKAEQRVAGLSRDQPEGARAGPADDDWVLTENPAILRYIARPSPRPASGPTIRARGRLRRMARLVLLRPPRRLRACPPARALRHDRRRQGRGRRAGPATTCRRRLGAGRAQAAAVAVGGRRRFLGRRPLPPGVLDLGPRPGPRLRHGADVPALDGPMRRVCARPAVRRALEREGLTPP